MLPAFFDWKISNNTNNADKREKWEQAKQIVTSNDWTVDELKQMENGCINARLKPVYLMALHVGSAANCINSRVAIV
jgi:hypothetical protein